MVDVVKAYKIMKIAKFALPIALSVTLAVLTGVKPEDGDPIDDPVVWG